MPGSTEKQQSPKAGKSLLSYARNHASKELNGKDNDTIKLKQKRLKTKSRNALSFANEEGLLKNLKHMPGTAQLSQLGGARHAAPITPLTDLGPGKP